MPSRKSSLVIAVAALLVVVVAFWTGFVAYPFLAPRLTGFSRPSSIQTTLDRNTYLKLSGEVYDTLSLQYYQKVDAGLVNVRLFNRSSGSQHVLLLKVERLDRLPAIVDYLKSGNWNVPWITRMGGPESTPPGGSPSPSSSGSLTAIRPAIRRPAGRRPFSSLTTA